MPERHRKNGRRFHGREFLVFDDVHVRARAGGAMLFEGASWTWRVGEQWAILGPDGAGKSVLVETLLGRVPVVRGEVRGPFPDGTRGELVSEGGIAHLSPRTQRDLATAESSFYQMRWHSGLEESDRTLERFLEQESVEERNPFEVGGLRGDRRRFKLLRDQLVGWLGIRGLMSRKLVHLSNGELRKALLAHTLLKFPSLLVLEDPYAGLDVRARRKLAGVIVRLMRKEWPVMMVTNRWEEIPSATTHLLVVRSHRVVAQGPIAAMREVWCEERGEARPEPNRRSVSGVGLTSGRIQARAAAGAGALVELRNVTVLGVGRHVLQGVYWTIQPGECWALLGPNGAGKSTLLSLIQGDHPQVYASDIRLFGDPTDSTQAVWRARERLGWMSPELHQHYPGACETLDVVCSGFYNSVGLHQTCSRRQRAAARRWLVEFDLGGLARTAFGDLSFGQQRLVLLARALVKEPALLMLDEPCQGLDAAQRRALLEAVDRVVMQTGAGLVFVSHYERELPGCITRVLRVRNGRIRTSGRRSRAT